MHASLKRAGGFGGQKSIMTRTDRIKWLKEKGKWTEESDVLGLPKIKVIKMKSGKKEKVAKDEKKDGAKGKK
jgi:small basic protein (TIGR04137 family)